MARPKMKDVIERFDHHGVHDAMLASRLATSVARALGELLPDNEAELLGDALPPELARQIERVEYENYRSEELFRRLGLATELSPEEAQHAFDLAIRCFGELLAPELVTHLESILPERVTRSLRPAAAGLPSSRSAGLLRTVHQYHHAGRGAP